MLESNLLVILVAVVTVVAVLYYGTQEDEGISGRAADSAAVGEWNKRAKAAEESDRQE